MTAFQKKLYQMWNLFKKKKNSVLDWLKFETFGWKQQDNYNNFRSWIKGDKTAFIGIELYDSAYPVKSLDIQQIISFERKEVVKESKGGLISCERLSISNCELIKVIRKEPLETEGVNYLGKLILPLSKSHIVIMLKICDNGITGIRDSILFDKWMGNNPDFKSDDSGYIIEWVADPYDSKFRKGRPMNLSEKEMYDSDFPNHPLTELRNKIKTLIDNISIDSKVTTL